MHSQITHTNAYRLGSGGVHHCSNRQVCTYHMLLLHTHTYAQVNIQAHGHINTNTYTHIHTHIHTYTHTYTHTHTHTHLYVLFSICSLVTMYAATHMLPPASTSSPSPASCGASGAHTHKELLGPSFPPLPFFLRHHRSPTHSFNNSICPTHSFNNAGDKTKIKDVSDRQ
jgi:hypothetical protein